MGKPPKKSPKPAGYEIRSPASRIQDTGSVKLALRHWRSRPRQEALAVQSLPQVKSHSIVSRSALDCKTHSTPAGSCQLATFRTTPTDLRLPPKSTPKKKARPPKSGKKRPKHTHTPKKSEVISALFLRNSSREDEKRRAKLRERSRVETDDNVGQDLESDVTTLYLEVAPFDIST